MKLRSKTLIVCILSMVLCMAPAVYGADDENAAAASESLASSPMENIGSSFVMGVDTYFGESNMDGEHRYSDGIWAANCAAYPSLTYLQYNGRKGDAVKVSVGTGELYTESSSAMDQPVEAYWQVPAGKASLTIGKFYVPFAQQEWLYDAKPGVMAQWAGDRGSLAASVNYSKDLNKTHFYLRGARKVAEDAEVGLSLGAGRGFCVDSIHDRGVGLDANIGFSGFRFYGESNLYRGSHSGSSFSYLSGKLYYEKLSRITPFVGSFWWNDRSGDLGKFRSYVLGADYQIAPQLTIEGAISSTPDKGISWLQFHWAWETSLKLF